MIIRIQQVNKKFGRLQVLDQVSLNCSDNACIALLGPNGCGKTTLIKSLLGMVIPDSGNICFNERDIRSEISYRRHIGYMPQIGRYPDNMSVGQVIDTIQALRSDEPKQDDDLIKAWKIDALRHKRMATLSGGTRQKVSACLAFLFDPKVLILDEPTAGLDPLAAEILKEKIQFERRKTKLILITSHLISELEEIVSQVVFMQDGQISLHENVEDLKQLTNEPTIAKAITQLLRRQLSHE